MQWARKKWTSTASAVDAGAFDDAAIMELCPPAYVGEEAYRNKGDCMKYITDEIGDRVGHICPKCGKEHRWDMYVFAHSHVELVGECDCGQKVYLRNLTAYTKEANHE